MFSQIRQGSQLYIVHDNANPYVEMGTVEAINNPMMMGYYPNLPSCSIDITVKIGDRTVPYQHLPANVESAEVVEQSSGSRVIIATNKDVVNTELQRLKQKSIDAINSVPYHEQRIKSLDSVIEKLNPEQAEKVAHAKELSDLKGQVSTLAGLVEKLTAKLDGHASSSN